MIAFLIDAYRNEIKNFTIGKYFAYFTFYPKVVSGPIVTYNEMQKGEENRDLIIPELSEPPVRTLGAAIPENESHIFR